MTYRNRSRWGLGLLALMLLTFGLAGCGGDEPAAVAAPPAPPPAPPPFVPQAVEVALGEHGGTITLMTTEAGGYTLNGEAFATGTDVPGDNDNTYTLTLDGTAWSAAYKVPEAMSLALGISGTSIDIQRQEDGSYQVNGSPVTNGTVIPAENGNMYTVMIGDDGMFSAEYVVPPALSIPLGASGSAVDVVRNEDGTFSANGEVITAETMVTAENGNVYRATLSPEGVPVGVMHVAAMQDVMLGELGGMIQLTQAEDKSWWYGEMAVMDGYVHTHENGNMYTLMMDAEGMWSAMYQKVEVMVSLGSTQESVTLERAEDMSWWLGSEAVDVASEVMSDNGNTYTLWYTDGVWSAQFEPESMMIEGTGLVAMTREGDDMYDVGDDTLPATGMGDVMDGDAMYHVWMQDGALAGARFDAAVDAGAHTDYKTGTIGLPALSANDPDTAANELRTHLILTGSAADDNEGMFSMGALLGSGMATDEGSSFVSGALETIQKVRSDVEVLLNLATAPTGLTEILEAQWSKLEAALDPVFKTQSAAQADASSAVRMTAPRPEAILNEIDDVLDALASEDAFVAATAAGGGGVFASRELGAGAASDAFNRLEWSATATLGATGATRYGTGVRKTTADAMTGLKATEVGAFSYSTMQETVRTSEAAAISLTGIASYTGGTEAVSASGTAYSGMMDLQVRFSSNSVSGVVSGLVDADGLPWQHNFADVDRIVLDDARLRRDARWTGTGTNATVFYTASSGLLRPISGLTNSFDGILLGRGAAAGSEANGVWGLNDPGSTNYLTGGFGVMHVGDATRPRPSGDSGGSSNVTLITSRALPSNGSVAVGDGNLTVKLQEYGWSVDPNTAGDLDYGGLTKVTDEMDADDPNDDVTAPVLITAEFDLEELAAAGAGAKTTVNGPTWVGSVRATVEAQRDQIATLQSLGTRTASTKAAETAAWNKAVQTIQYELFGGDLPVKLAEGYMEDDALGLLDRALDALANANSLFAALDPEGTGIFDHYDTDLSTVGVQEGNYIKYDSNADSRRWEFINNARTLGAFLGEREHKVVASLGTTDYGRFGVWYRVGAVSAQRSGNTDSARNATGYKGVKKGEGGPGAFAYSPLDATIVASVANPPFPDGGSASYMGETVAIMDEDVLTGTARVDVSWASATDSDRLDLVVSADGRSDTTSYAGSMTLTLGGLADSTGDPLTFSSQTVNTDTTEGREIAEIVFSGMRIEVGLPGGQSGRLIVGDETEGAAGTYTYGELRLTASNDVRYRLAAIGETDLPGVEGTNTVTTGVGALFVGQGVDGPLGVIGTWTLDDDRVHRVRPPTGAGVRVEEGNIPIYGSFGADVP